MRLGATDFALPAAIVCSLRSGVQKLEIFSYTKKFGLVMLTILAGEKICYVTQKLKLSTIYEATKSIYKITVSGAAAAARPTHHTMSHRIPMSHVHFV